MTEELTVARRIRKLLTQQDQPLGQEAASPYRLLVVVDADNVGLATEATLGSVLARLARLQIYDSAAAAWKDVADRLPISVDADNVGLATEATLSGVLAEVSYVGGPRLENREVDSGYLTVPAKTTYTYLSVSGLGIMVSLHVHYSSGIGPGYAMHLVFADGDTMPYAWMPHIANANMLGFTAAGNYEMGQKFVYIPTWDTVNNVYDVEIWVPSHALPFRVSLACHLRNEATTDSTQRGRMHYAPFVSTKKFLLKIDPSIPFKEPDDRLFNASLLKRLTELGPLNAFMLRRLGYYYPEEEHPYREFPEHFPNVADDRRPLEDVAAFESHIRDVAKREPDEFEQLVIERGYVPCCTVKRAPQALEVWVPDEVDESELMELLGRLSKRVKIVYDEEVKAEADAEEMARELGL